MSQKTIGIIIKDNANKPALYQPLVNWLKSNGIECITKTIAENREGANYWLWLVKDDDLSGITPSGNDYAVAATAPDAFNILHPAVSISSRNCNSQDGEFSNCYWMIKDAKDKQTIVSYLGIPEDKIVVLDSHEKRVAYHLALCIVVPEVFTLFETAKDVLKATGLGDLWPKVEDTAKRTVKQYTNDHYHGPASRGDRGTLEKHFSIITKNSPWIGPLYLELIQYRVAKTAILKKRYDDLGLGKREWDVRSAPINIDAKYAGDSFVSKEDAQNILEETSSLLTCSPLLLSITFFQLELGSTSDPLTVNLSGQGFALSWCKEVYDEFNKQVSYFLGANGHTGISKRIAQAKVSDIKPYVVVPKPLAAYFVADKAYMDIIISQCAGSKMFNRSKDPTFTMMGPFGGAEDAECSSPHVISCTCDGWFPTTYNNVTELVIPIFRFASSAHTPLLEGLITVIAPIDEIVRLTPTRINEIQSVALKRYLSTGYLERRIVELGRRAAEADTFQKIKPNLEKIHAGKEIMNGILGALDNIALNVDPNFIAPGRAEFISLSKAFRTEVFPDGINHEASGHQDTALITESLKTNSQVLNLLTELLSQRMEKSTVNDLFSPWRNNGAIIYSNNKPINTSLALAKWFQHMSVPWAWVVIALGSKAQNEFWLRAINLGRGEDNRVSPVKFITALYHLRKADNVAIVTTLNGNTAQVIVNVYQRDNDKDGLTSLISLFNLNKTPGMTTTCLDALKAGVKPGGLSGTNNYSAELTDVNGAEFKFDYVIETTQ